MTRPYGVHVLLKVTKTAKVTSLALTRSKFNRITRALACFKDSVNFLIGKSIDNPLFKKMSKKGNVYYNYSSYPKIRKYFYHEWKSYYPDFHTHYCHSSARITKDVLKSWNSWCFKKKRRLNNPFYKKNSMKLEKCLCYLDGNNVVLVIEPRNKLYIPFKPTPHFNEVKTRYYGEITLKLNDDGTASIFIPFYQDIEEKPAKSIVSIDVNERSVDIAIITPSGVTFKTIDASDVSTTHYTYSLKRKSIAANIDNNERYKKQQRKELLDKYGKKERDKNKHSIHDLANQVVEMVEQEDATVVMEKLTDIRQSNSRQKNLKPWQRKKSKKLRRRLNRWNFRQFQDYVEYKTNSTGHLVERVNPRNTSQKCLKCGKKTKCNRQVFKCKHCGFTMNRHLLATINIAEEYFKNQHVASTVPAEGHHMKAMRGAFRKCKETITGDASQHNEFIEIYPNLST
ncbi:MAG: zinc ribbon domain-containing protein [Candidatus Hodarchaeota archaeon]